MNDYDYPDTNDALTESFINNKSNSLYWQESEEYILEKEIEKIKSLNSKKMLDVGCGTGRLFKTYLPYVDSIYALEPDKSRYKEALEELKKLNTNKISIYNDDINSIQNKKFDIVLISHVFQHISIDMIKNILYCLKNIVPAGGLLIITTTYTNNPDDVYTIEKFIDGKNISTEVSQEEFNENIGKVGILPVKEISSSKLNSLLEEYGFILEEMYGFHFDITLMNNCVSVSFDKKRNEEKNYEGAKDALYIARRKHE